MSFYLTVDFGSTYTKICAVDAKGKKVLGTSKAFTTIATDVRDGYRAAFRELEKSVGKLEYGHKLACSSAGGGLKMAAVGLVPELTAKAARMAASSAGAKVMATYSYELSPGEQEEIYNGNPDILLLCGGTDGGNKEVIIQNAKAIAKIDRDFSVIFAGNKSAAGEAEEALKKAGKNVILCKNVMPSFGILDIAPAKEAIRALFIEKIIDARGLTKIQEEMTGKLIPTPLAVFEGAELFSRGVNGETGMGDIMAVDVGGATTDVYTMCEGKPSMPNAVIKGLAEPFAKRSVEGDMGLRYNIDSIAESAGLEKASDDLQIDREEIRQWIAACKKDPGIVPEAASSFGKIDSYLTRRAVEISSERHCGSFESVYTPMGETIVMVGKDLTQVPALIGIGGPLINSRDPANLLRGAVYDPAKPVLLKPAKPKFYLDKKYIFSSMGLIGKIDPVLSLKIMKEEICEIY